MNNTYGNRFRFTIFGHSHGPAIGVSMEGLPANWRFDPQALQAFLDRRAPGAPGTTARREADRPEFISGVTDGVTNGAPVVAVIRNTDCRPEDYDALRDTPRPGHADFTARAKYGNDIDLRGGGPFSGRMTAPLCIAGGLCLQLLDAQGIRIRAALLQVGQTTQPAQFARTVEDARSEGDSVGAIIECTVTGLPAGVGAPMFGGLENRIAAAAFAIPGVKGIEFGSGFAGAARRGSENNDAFTVCDGRVVTRTNAHGGILGGISSGMPIVFRVACKPTPSIARPQTTVNLRTMEELVISIPGRHDPCFALRAVPCVEAAAAVAVYDALREAE